MPGHLNHKNSYQQAMELQRLILNDAKDPTLKPVIRAALARAFCELEETKRKIKMRPLPKAIDVQKVRHSRDHAIKIDEA